MKLRIMKKMLMGMAASILLPLSASADDVVTLKLIGSDGTTKQYALDEITRLDFSQESFTLIFNNNAADETFRYEDVLKMNFGSVATAIQNVANEEEVSITYKANVLSIEGCSGVLRIYDVSGRPVMSEKVDGATQISTDQLSAGVYIVKINTRTFKFSRL